MAVPKFTARLGSPTRRLLEFLEFLRGLNRRHMAWLGLGGISAPHHASCLPVLASWMAETPDLQFYPVCITIAYRPFVIGLHLGQMTRS
jgi:hypothetical protein